MTTFRSEFMRDDELWRQDTLSGAYILATRIFVQHQLLDALGSYVDALDRCRGETNSRQ